MVQFDCIERRLAALFYRYGKLVYRCPTPFIVIPILITCGLACGLVWRLRVIKDDISLYTPEDGRAKSEKQSLRYHFDIDDTDPYFAERRFDSKRFGYIIATPQDSSQNVLSADIFEEIHRLWATVERLTVKRKDRWYNYSSLCITVPYTNSCVSNPLLQMYSMHPLSLLQLNYPLTANGIFIGNLLGGVVISNQSFVGLAKAMLLPYQLKFSTNDKDSCAEKWENSLIEFFTSYSSPTLTVAWWTSETLAGESYKDTKILLKLLAPLFVVVTVFTIVCCFVKSWRKSKPWLGLCGVASAAGSIVSSIGLCLLGGEKLTSVSYFMPFVIFSIGVDNVFILIAAWRKTSVLYPVSERMASTLKEAGVSITVTSLTDVLSFGVGCTSNFPSVKNFCLYAAVAVSFVYIYLLTFFTGCMVVSGSRENASRNCSTLKTMSQKQMKFWSTDYSITFSEEVSKTVRTEEDIASNHILARFFRGPYTNFLTNSLTKCVVILCTLAYIGVAVWGCTKIKIGLHPLDLLPKSSHARQTLNLYETYFTDYSDNLHLWFTNLTTLNYDSRFWLILDREVRRFENTTYSEFSDSWLRAFIVFARTAGLSVTPDNFLSVLKNAFLTKPFYEKYTRDIVFTPKTGSRSETVRLEAVRFIIRMRNVDFSSQNEAAHFFRALADSSPLSAHVYSDYFEFTDQFDAVLPSILSNLAQGSAAVVAASLLLIPKPLCSVWVCATIASITVGIFGYTALWGVNLDFVSMVTITMSIGFSVDFSAHIAYHFAKDHGVSTVDRVRDAVYVVGTPILQSAVSTLLGILMLVAVDNYVFRSFLKTSFLIILLGVAHGLVILPVLLTLFHCDTSGNNSSTTVSTYGSNEKLKRNSNDAGKSSTVSTPEYNFPGEMTRYDPQNFTEHWNRTKDKKIQSFKEIETRRSNTFTEVTIINHLLIKSMTCGIFIKTLCICYCLFLDLS